MTTRNLATWVMNQGAAPLLQSGLLLTSLGVAAGLLNYAFQLLMGRLLTADDFLAFNAIVATSLVVGAPLAAVQTVATQYVASVSATVGTAGARRLFFRWLTRGWLVVAAALLATAAATPQLMAWLRLPDHACLWMLVAIACGMLLAAVNGTFFHGLQWFSWLGGLPLATTLLKILLCSLFVGTFAGGLHGALAGVVTATALGIAAGSWTIFAKTSPATHSPTPLPPFPYALLPPVIAGTFGLVSMTQIDLVLVNRYFAPAEASQYALAAVLGKVVLYLPAGMAAAILPIVAANHARDQTGHRTAASAVLLTLLLSGCVALGFFLVGPRLVDLLYGQKYGAAGELLRFYGPAMVPMAAVIVIHNYMVARSRRVYSWLIGMVAVLEIAVLDAWHPSLEMVLGIIAALNAALALSGIIFLFVPPTRPATLTKTTGTAFS